MRAVEAGQFHIHTADHARWPGIADRSASGLQAFEQTGTYPGDSILGRAERTLSDYRQAPAARTRRRRTGTGTARAADR